MGGSGNDLSRDPPAFGCLLQQRFHCEMLASECVQECAGDCKHSVLFGFAKEAQFTFNCFVHISNRCSLFSCQWLPVLGMQEAGNVAGWILPCPGPEQDLPPLPPPNTLHMAVQCLAANCFRNHHFQALGGRLLIFMRLFCGEQETLM